MDSTRFHRAACITLLVTAISAGTIVAGDESNFTYVPVAEFGELAATQTLDSKARIYVNRPGNAASATSTRLLIYALPNGNTIEQTLGCRMSPGLDWHYDIQHVAAQTRLLRELHPDERLILACAEAGGLSWPTFRKQPDANQRIACLLDDWRVQFAGEDARVTLAGHSGGGSFIFGVIEGNGEIPAYIDRIIILDANYAFDKTLHAEKLARWLVCDLSRRLIVVAYDDREIELDGKKVVGPTGGTFRATERMVKSLGPEFNMLRTESPPWIEWTGLGGNIHFYIHTNPENKILHTALVGEMNGLVHGQTLGTPLEEKWGKFGGPQAFTKWIQEKPAVLDPSPRYSGERLGEGQRYEEAGGSENPSPSPSLRGRWILKTIPVRSAKALGGRAFVQSLAGLDRAAREAAILREVSAGNVPDFLRKFVSVRVSAAGKDGRVLSGSIEVAPDYLAVGSDADWIRIPMNPQTAQAIADMFGCTLPTRKMVDAIDAAAEVHFPPEPLTEDRESVAAFILAHDRTESHRNDQPLGDLTIGAKKDVVLSPKIHERADRVAIYGWRQLNGKPIQPLTTVHVNWYVDYSHGVRLVRNEMQLNGRLAKITEVLADPKLAPLFSDEGPIKPPRYPAK